MTDAEIDDAILAVAETSWRKIAMIVAKASDRLGSKIPEGDDVYQLIARRIAALVGDNRLEAQGDIEQWRHSEVRLR